jgi:hypothetical protein
MDINSARIILAQMQGCFKELDIPYINEDEMLNRSGFSNAIKFRSWLTKLGNLAEILAYVMPDHDIVQLSMNYGCNFEDLDEETSRNLFALLNTINNSDPAFYWLYFGEADKLEFRTAYWLSGDRLIEKQFKSVLESFLKRGPLYFTYFKRLIDYNEDPDLLFNEIQHKTGAALSQ